MQTRVDYIGFTLKREPQNDETEQTVVYQVTQQLTERFLLFGEVFAGVGEWGWTAGRRPYRSCYSNIPAGVFIYVHPALPHSLIEITGRGCEILSDSPHSANFLDAFKDRLTRLDLACDMLTETRPTDFVAQREPGRFKSDGHITEESGETCYIGSRSSDRYAAVYRYNPPHERSHLLRCEYRLRAENARITAEAVLTHGMIDVAAALGVQFGWKHPDWKPENPTEIELRAFRPDRHEGKTLFWLAETVAPLIVRLHREGVLDAREWLSTHVLKALEQNDAS